MVDTIPTWLLISSLVLGITFGTLHSDDYLGALPFKAAFRNNHLTLDKPTAFPWDFSMLNDHLQSPVDVITTMAVKQNFPEKLKFTAVDDDQIISVISNSGHGVTITIESNEVTDCLKPRLSGAFLDDEYVFENIHYHWGKADYFGSEHFINGESFSLEGHMVTYKKKYKNIDEALNHKDGVVVLAFFATTGKNNEKMKHLLRHIPSIVCGNSSVSVKGVEPILWFVPDVIKSNSFSHYYVYPGSLTTDPFTESVTFILMPEPIQIGQDQLDTLRTIQDDENNSVETNRREIQPLRGRPLISSNNFKWVVKKRKN